MYIYVALSIFLSGFLSMKIGIFLVSIVFSLFLPGHIVYGGISVAFTPNKRLSGFLMEKISPIGKKMCVKECAKRVSCASLNFHRGRLECELSFKDGSTNPTNLTSDKEYVYIERKEIPQVYIETCDASCSPLGSCIQTATGPKCIQSDCPSNHPDANTTSVKVTSTKVGTVLTLTCTSYPSINLTSTCRNNGTWSSSSSSCKTPDCPDLHPDATLTSVMVTATKVGTILTYTCNSDPSITLTSTCRSNGTWSSPAYVCGQQSNPPDCFNITNSCWYKYNFTHGNEFNGCAGGPRYVKETGYTSAPLVGVVLCSPTRYKLFLGENLTTTFYNIGDGSGSGQDHCELVGGSQSTAIIPGDYPQSPAVTGYYRKYEGAEFEFGKIGAAQSSNWLNSYLECGISIPGTGTLP